jgi:mono/diheme cytochrome c family protein
MTILQLASAVAIAVGGLNVHADQGRGVITSPRNAYPEREVADPAAVERGKALYGANCAFCHGADTRGGDSGPSLLRSSAVLDDQHGELIGPILQSGRPDRGMPKFSFNPSQVESIAAFIHSFKAAGYDESRRRPPSILVGDAKVGQTFFAGKCASCHSATGDLAGIASRISDERLLQQTWLMPGSGGGRGGPPPVQVRPTTVVVTMANGEKLEGKLDRIDDFNVTLTTADGARRTVRATPDVKIDVGDPLQPHRQLWTTYTDSDIHNVTAYLATLK